MLVGYHTTGFIWVWTSELNLSTNKTMWICTVSSTSHLPLYHQKVHKLNHRLYIICLSGIVWEFPLFIAYIIEKNECNPVPSPIAPWGYGPLRWAEKISSWPWGFYWGWSILLLSVSAPPPPHSMPGPRSGSSSLHLSPCKRKHTSTTLVTHNSTRSHTHTHTHKPSPY